MNARDYKRGFISTLLVLVLALILLKFVFDISPLDILRHPTVATVLSYVKKFFIIVWDKFIETPARFVWDKIIVEIIWKYGKEVLELIKRWIDSQ
ncbi:hypothetical protein EPN83_02165 [Patescibacteria group bacterium]|nr:MAG: hypothetical protein EPN83_02165 [Patescibacteria group bacterium]